MADLFPDASPDPPFETEELRAALTAFLDTPFAGRPVGGWIWGVYAFFDYDGEPIYVGQTKERLGTRIRRHLTNQRTDAVAMSVLDPFEVHSVTVWPLPELQSAPKGDAAARAHLDALEHLIYTQAIADSRFKAILNEKNPPLPRVAVTAPQSLSGDLVSPAVYRLRAHPDTRLARRALIISRLAQVIAERKVQGGLRRVLLTQARRLESLADRRFGAMGGEGSVAREAEDGDD